MPWVSRTSVPAARDRAANTIQAMANSNSGICSVCGAPAILMQKVRKTTPRGYETGEFLDVLVCYEHRQSGWTLVRELPVATAS
jgi:hypothetical protein